MGYECMSVQLVSVVFMKSQNNNFTKDNNQIWYFSWPITGYFSFICVFQTHKTSFTTKKREKMSIQYTVLRFKPTTFGT